MSKSSTQKNARAEDRIVKDPYPYKHIKQTRN
jgi:hypothetical protein